MSRRAQKSFDFWFYPHDVMLPIPAMRFVGGVAVATADYRPLYLLIVIVADLGLDLMRWFSQNQISAQ